MWLPIQILIRSVIVERFFEIWDEVGKDRINKRREKQQLEDWLAKVPNAAPYWGTQHKDEASQEVVVQLKMILIQFDQGGFNKDKKEKTLLDIIEKSDASPPIWVEFTGAIYMNLLTGAFRDYILRLVQQFKENIVLHYVQVTQRSTQWHKINEIRYICGTTFGLVTDNLDQDGFYHVDPCACFYDTSKQAFFSGYLVGHLITYLEGEMHTDTQQHNALIECLTTAVQKDDPGMSPPDVDEYVKTHYFYPFKGDLTQTEEYRSFNQAIQESTQKIQLVSSGLWCYHLKSSNENIILALVQRKR